jgi:hypothetical protein
MTMHEDDLDAVLRAAFPKGHTYLRCEGGLALLNHSARTLIGTPSVAREVLGAKGTKAMASAVRAVSERYRLLADRLDQLAADKSSRPVTAKSGTCNTEES